MVGEWWGGGEESFDDSFAVCALIFFYHNIFFNEEVEISSSANFSFFFKARISPRWLSELRRLWPRVLDELRVSSFP